MLWLSSQKRARAYERAPTGARLGHMAADTAEDAFAAMLQLERELQAGSGAPPPPPQAPVSSVDAQRAVKSVQAAFDAMQQQRLAAAEPVAQPAVPELPNGSLEGQGPAANPSLLRGSQQEGTQAAPRARDSLGALQQAQLLAQQTAEQPQEPAPPGEAEQEPDSFADTVLADEPSSLGNGEDQAPPAPPPLPVHAQPAAQPAPVPAQQPSSGLRPEATPGVWVVGLLLTLDRAWWVAADRVLRAQIYHLDLLELSTLLQRAQQTCRWRLCTPSHAHSVQGHSILTCLPTVCVGAGQLQQDQQLAARCQP